MHIAEPPLQLKVPLEYNGRGLDISVEEMQHEVEAEIESYHMVVQRNISDREFTDHEQMWFKKVTVVSSTVCVH